METDNTIKPHYFNILGLFKDPFTTSPDPYYYYPLPHHQSCLAHLEIGVRLRRGANVIFGEIGTGKTTLCRTLLRRLKDDSSIETHLLLNPSYGNEKEFINSLMNFFHLSYDNLSMQEALNTLKHYLFNQGVIENKTIVLIIDEAQKLSRDTIEILRTLLNFETNEYKLLQLILLGQLQLKDILKEIPNFVDRINYKTELPPLSFEECLKLIKFRIGKSCINNSPGIFTKSAIKAIHELSSGYPRKICMLAHKTLEELVILKRKRANERLIYKIHEREAVI